MSALTVFLEEEAEDTPVSEETVFSDLDHGELYIFGDINSDMAKSVVWAIARMLELNFKDITLYISSGGGSAIHSFSIVEMLMVARQAGVTLTTYAMGGCASGAADIFLCGHKRVIGKYCYFMLHDAQCSVAGENVKSLIKDGQLWVERTKDFMQDVLSDTKIDYKVYESKCDEKDWVITPKEAVRLGIAHLITTFKKEVKPNGRRKTSSGRTKKQAAQRAVR